MLLALAAMADQTEHHTVRISSRKLAERTAVARSKVVPALDSLTARGLITTRQGTTKSASAYLVNALNTLQIGGPLTGPPHPLRGPCRGPP